MKRIFIVLFALSLVLTLSACKLLGSITQADDDPPLHRVDITTYAGTPLEFVTEDAAETENGGVNIPSLSGAEWPDNEFTKLVPKPDLNLLTVSEEDGEFTAAFTGATIEQIRAYAEKLKSAGFNNDAEVQDEEIMGMAIYTFSASDSKNHNVKLSYTAGTATLVIE